MSALQGIEPPLRSALEASLSLSDFWQFVEDHPDVRCERTADGDLLLMTPSFGTASFLTSYVNRMLGNWADEDERGFVLDSNVSCLLPDGSVLMPDAAWISGSRWRPAPIEEDAAVPCPEFVIEVRSKSDRLTPLQEKMGVWIANGAELGWLVDARRKTLEIYRPGQAMESQEGHSAAYGEGPVAGFVLELARIWGLEAQE